MNKLILALTLAPIAVQAESYGTPEGCAMIAGTAEYATDGRVVWDRNAGTLEFHETKCRITEVAQIGSGGIGLATTCSGEGDTWQQYYHLYTTSDDDHYVLASEDAPSVETDLFLCE